MLAFRIVGYRRTKADFNVRYREARMAGMGYLLPKEEMKNKWQLTNEERTDMFIGTIRHGSASYSPSRLAVFGRCDHSEIKILTCHAQKTY
jgi:predicted SprT family Zn-dependent metalloprotease